MASTLTGFQTPRPMTYQLAASLVAALSGSVDEVRVVRLSENTYIAEVLLAGPSGTKVVDARPSDAINLALLTGAPVRVASDVLDQWATTSERVDLDEYPDDAQAIRAELGPFFPASLEQLAPDAAEVMVLARQEAIDRAHRAVGTGHILLAVLRRSSAEQLTAQGLSVATVQIALDGEPSSPTPSEAPPLSPPVVASAYAGAASSGLAAQPEAERGRPLRRPTRSKGRHCCPPARRGVRRQGRRAGHARR